MKVIIATTEEENGIARVQLKFKARDQLLNPDDPTPLPQQELTQDAEDSILNNIFALKLKKPAILEVLLPGQLTPGEAVGISEAIRYHFRFLLTEHQRDTGIFLRERRAALAMTVVNILIAAIFILFLNANPNIITSLGGIVIATIIIIMNWATIWDTYEFFIFDGREKSHRRKLLEKIIRCEIRVVPIEHEK